MRLSPFPRISLPSAVLLSVLLVSVSLGAQTAPAAPAPKPAPGVIGAQPDWPRAKDADVDSIEHTVASLYDVISGPAGQRRDWTRMRSLFVPGGRLMPATHEGARGDLSVMSIDDYVARVSARFEANGFFERATHNEIAAFGSIVHVFSTYESRHGSEDATPFARGINSIQLLKDGGRYWIVDVLWDAERPETPIPARYLPGNAAPSPATGIPQGALNSNLNGDWVGQLEYRDFGTNARVFLPTWLTLAPGVDGSSVALSYTYDDGPGKIVRENSTLVIASDGLAGDTAVLGSATEKQRFTVVGLDEFRKQNRGTLILTGPGKDNKKPVEVRLTLTLRRNLFTMVKEIRLPGGEFQFRDGYTFTRAGVPGA